MDNVAKRQQALDDIERVVDAFSVREALAFLDEVCGMKAEHVREHWQDGLSARVWERTGRKIEKLARTIEEV